MDRKNLNQAAALFAECYIKRYLESRYDRLMELPWMSGLKAMNPGMKYGVEALLAAIATYAGLKLPDQSPWAGLVKNLVSDAAPEISSRILKETGAEGLDREVGTLIPGLLGDARTELRNEASTGALSMQSVAEKLLALSDEELLAVLVASERMGAGEKARFLNFLMKSPSDELRRLAALPPERRAEFLNLTAAGSSGKRPPGEFFKDFLSICKSGASAGRDVLKRYLSVLWQVFKSGAVLWLLALIACTAGAVLGRWPLTGVLSGLLALSGWIVFLGARLQQSWLKISGIAGCGVIAVLILLAAGGYPDAVAGTALFLLVLPPGVATALILLPLTMTAEAIRSGFPEAYAALVRAFRFLLAAFFTAMFLAVFLLVFPPQNPVAMLFIIPTAILLFISVAAGWLPFNPDRFLKVPVLLGTAAVFAVLLGLMSMPNMRYRLQGIPAAIDRLVAESPEPLVVDASSKGSQVLADVPGRTLWYLENSAGGYEFYSSQGNRTCFSPDGRPLKKIGSETVRQHLSQWVDRAAIQAAEEDKTRFMNRYLNQEAIPSSGLPVTALVLISGSDSALNRMAEEMIVNAAQVSGLNAQSGILRSAFFDEEAAGVNAQRIQDLDIARIARFLWLGRMRVATEVKTGYQNLTVCQGALELQCVSTKDGTVVFRENIPVTGKAFSAESARGQLTDGLANSMGLTIGHWKEKGCL